MDVSDKILSPICQQHFDSRNSPKHAFQPFICSRDKSQEDTNTSPPNPMNCPAGYIPLKKACWKINSSAATQANAEAACQADRQGQFTSGNFLSKFLEFR